MREVAKDQEITRLRSLSTRWYLADGTYNTMPGEEVIRLRIEAAGVLKRAGDVEGMAKAIINCPEWIQCYNVDNIARAVSAYLLGKE